LSYIKQWQTQNKNLNPFDKIASYSQNQSHKSRNGHGKPIIECAVKDSANDAKKPSFAWRAVVAKRAEASCIIVAAPPERF